MRLQIIVEPTHKLPMGRKSELEQFLNGGNQIVLDNWLDEDVPSTASHRTYYRLEAVGFGQDNEVGTNVLPPNGSHDLEAAEVRKVDVQNGNVNVRCTDGTDCFATEPGCLYAPRIGLRPDDFPEACTDPNVAVGDDEPDTPGRMEWRSVLVG
ncbi:MAG: hypothetical protein OXR72_01760 [Gemmatimonadota bacterium]|nr:hypothetical protein [Gemmatimonadota bacterium]